MGPRGAGLELELTRDKLGNEPIGGIEHILIRGLCFGWPRVRHPQSVPESSSMNDRLAQPVYGLLRHGGIECIPSRAATVRVGQSAGA